MGASYDPSAIADRGLNQMRFELGDTDVDAPVLLDEEIRAVLKVVESFDRAGERLADAVFRRYAHEVDMSADGMKLELSQRAARWQTVRDEFRARMAKTRPRGGAKGNGYFFAGIMDNLRAGGGDNG